jgi:hypothetical protein
VSSNWISWRKIRTSAGGLPGFARGIGNVGRNGKLVQRTFGAGGGSCNLAFFTAYYLIYQIEDNKFRLYLYYKLFKFTYFSYKIT